MSRGFAEFFSDIYRCVGKVKNVTFIVTNDCQCRCTYCYQPNKINKSMSLETAKKCVDMLFAEDETRPEYINEYEANGLILDFIGGEPLLEVNLIRKTYEYFLMEAMRRKHRWAVRHMISMTSNGVAYFEPEVQEFLNLYKDKISFSITLDGNKELHDSCRVLADGSPTYDIAAKAVRHANENVKRVETKITLSPDNIRYLFDACTDMFTKFGFSYIHANPVFEHGWEVRHATLYYDQLKKLADWLLDGDRYVDYELSLFDMYIGHPLPEEETHNWCGGTGAMLAFDVDGSIYPCVRYAPVSMAHKQPGMIIGHCDRGIATLEDEVGRIRMLNSITRQSQSSKECLDCKVASGCAWCSAYNYEINGTPNKRVTYICDLHKARSLANVYFFNQLFIKNGLKTRAKLNLTESECAHIISGEEYNFLKELCTHT